MSKSWWIVFVRWRQKRYPLWSRHVQFGKSGDIEAWDFWLWRVLVPGFEVRRTGGKCIWTWRFFCDGVESWPLDWIRLGASSICDVWVFRRWGRLLISNFSGRCPFEPPSYQNLPCLPPSTFPAPWRKTAGTRGVAHPLFSLSFPQRPIFKHFRLQRRQNLHNLCSWRENRD